MTNIHAAVVTSFDEPPHFQSFALPNAANEDEMVVDVVAAGLHPRVRTDATGKHYTSTGVLPMVPGIDGVGRTSKEEFVYFVVDDEKHPGSMAEKAVIDRRRSIILPNGADAVKIAAGMNPAMSSWVALRRRVALQPNQSVLVLGATGNAGMMAIQVAKYLGAGHVVGAGRDEDRLQLLAQLGADEVVRLTSNEKETTDEFAEKVANVDIVIDYLWSTPAAQVMQAIASARTDPSKAIDWIQIGSMAGASLALPSSVLRSTNLRIQGNGQGAVSPKAYLAELPSLIEAITNESLKVVGRPALLKDVESIWRQPDVEGERTVFIP